jgi:CubicO group peptidase (beta-lactamase class C family)
MTNAPRLPRSAPEDQGVDSAALTALFRAIDRDVAHAHNIIVMRHGHVIAEGTWAPYRPEDPHMFFSLSKSFTSTAIGLAIDEGRLTANDRVLPYFERCACTTC